MIIIKSKKEIEIMREAGKIVAGAHEVVAKAIALGITTARVEQDSGGIYIPSKGLFLRLRDIRVFRPAYVPR